MMIAERIEPIEPAQAASRRKGATMTSGWQINKTSPEASRQQAGPTGGGMAAMVSRAYHL